MMANHPAAELFPLMSATEYAGLLEDIRAHGLLEPVLVDSKTRTIIDGRNRYRACRELEIKPDLEWWDGDDPTALVVSKNLHRRHLSESQRAMIAARIATLRRGDNQHTAIAGTSQREAASLLNVSPDSISRARVVLEKGTPDVVAAVDAGKLPVSRAVQQIAVKEQREALRAMMQESREEMEGWAKDLTPEGRELWDNENLGKRGALARLLRDILSLGDPKEFAAKHGRFTREKVLEHAEQVRAWLAAFLEEVIQ